MEILNGILLVVFVFVCAALILAILLQPGKGEGLALGTVTNQYFGGGGAMSFLAKVTSALAILYMILVMGLGKIQSLSEKPATAPAQIQQSSTTPSGAAKSSTPTTSTPASKTTPATSGTAKPSTTPSGTTAKPSGTTEQKSGGTTQQKTTPATPAPSGQ